MRFLLRFLLQDLDRFRQDELAIDTDAALGLDVECLYVKRHLSFSDSSESLAFAMAEVFGPALKRGARIVRRGEGLGTLVRRT